MKKIDIVYFGYLGSTVGPATNIKLFMQYSDLFKENNIELTVFSKDKTINMSSNQNIEPVLNKQFYNIKSILNPLALHSYLVTIFMIYRQYFYNAKKTMLSYLKLNREPEGLFFQDIFSCYYYLKYKRGVNGKVALMLRNNGDTWKMLLDYYPKARGQFIIKKLLEIESFVLDNIQKVGFVSENSMNNFIRLHPKYKAKAFFVHNGLPDLPKYTYPSVISPIILTCAGSINTRKGQDIIVDSICELDKSVQEKLKIVFLGDGPSKHALEAKIEKHALNKIVEFVGNTTNVNKYLEETHGFILCSRDEGLPMSIIEAMRARRAIFSTRVAGIPELVIENVSGVLINPTTDELKVLLENIAMGAYDIEEMGNQSRALYEESFTLNKTIKGFCKILNEIT